ncbi:zf-HC2 domain-containing protein [Myxococcus landrumensis]|uniref:Zf-HC2 domain-containing protein n=1 Tax=Myxococcus landrumensis TaxID=2813577 RepID=A0ABX7NBD8_9BACT|nr:zf-HC2 domain-containing protein [Myxococcus landrumus]QSQ14716.1 zf-HC2 domain-containing protein [Myxococcus landrumus]
MKPQNVHAQEDRLLDFAYGELPVSEAQAVESHLQGCPRCTQTLSEIRGVRVTMAQLTEEPAPDAGLESLLAYAQQSARRAAAGPAPQSSRWRRWLLPVVGLASAGTLSVLTFMAVSPDLTQPNLSAVEAKQVAEAPAAPPPTGGAAAAPTGPAPASAVAPPAQALADANQYGGDKDSALFAKESVRSESAEAERAEGWEAEGSGGGVGTRRRADELKAQAPSVQKVSREKAPSRMASNLDGEAPLKNAPTVAVAMAPAPPSPPRETLRLGGGGSKQESSRAEELGGSAKSWDEAPGAPALESVTEPLARGGVVASAPAPVEAPVGRGSGVDAPMETAKAMPARAQRPPQPVAKKAKGDVSLEARAAPAAEFQQEADDQVAPAPKRSVAELSRLAQEARRTGDRAQEVSLLRLALEAGATGSTRMDLLTRVCDAELALGRRGAGVAACQQVLAESPGSQAAQAARRRLSDEPVSGEPANAVDAKPAE